MQVDAPKPHTSNGGLSRDRRRHHLEQILLAVLAEEKFEDPRWTSFSVVFSSTASGRNFGNSGYAYGEGNDWWAVSFPVVQVREPITNFMRESLGIIPEGLCRVLLQYDRGTRRGRLVNEFRQPERWTVTPENARNMVAELKPRFDEVS